MAALKLTETARRRDWLIVLGASLFLLLAACLDAQALWRLPLYAAELWLLCTAHCTRSAPAPMRRRLPALLRRSALSLRWRCRLRAAVPVCSAPARLVLGHAAAGRGVTGLGDEMSPGQHLATDAIGRCRRCACVSMAPCRRAAQRYWRGPVLHEFDGYTWRRAACATWAVRRRCSSQGPAYRYEITLEPNSAQRADRAGTAARACRIRCRTHSRPSTIS